MKIIANMGLFWLRDAVYWGERGAGKKGRLRGKLSTALKSNPVDFWKQIGIYALYSDYQLAYVGQSGGRSAGLGPRMRVHLTDDFAGRWNMFSWIGLRFVKRTDSDLSNLMMNSQRNARVSALLDVFEGILIAFAEPRLNGQDGRFGDDVARYIQVPDEKAVSADQQRHQIVMQQLQAIEKKP